MIRIQTEALRACADEVSSLRRYTSDITDNLRQAAGWDAEGTVPYLQALQKAEDLEHCFSSMSVLLTQISEDADAMIRKIRELTEQYAYAAQSQQ